MRGPPITIDDRRTPRSVPPLLGLGLGGATVPTPPGLFLEGLAAINRGRAAGWLKSACGRTCAQRFRWHLGVCDMPFCPLVLSRAMNT